MSGPDTVTMGFISKDILSFDIAGAVLSQSVAQRKRFPRSHVHPGFKANLSLETELRRTHRFIHTEIRIKADI